MAIRSKNATFHDRDFTLSPAAMQRKRSVNYRRGDDISLHVVVRGLECQLVANSKIDDKWQRELVIELAPDMVERELILTVSPGPQGTTLKLDGEEMVCLLGSLAVTDADDCQPHPDLVPMSSGWAGIDAASPVPLIDKRAPRSGTGVRKVEVTSQAPADEMQLLPRGFGAATTRVAGAIDHFDAIAGVSGWALARDRAALSVEARCGGQVIAIAPVDIPRPDLASSEDATPVAGFVVPWHAFDVRLLEALVADDRSAKIEFILPGVGRLPVVFGDVTAALSLRHARGARHRKPPQRADATTPDRPTDANPAFDERHYASQLEDLALSVPAEQLFDHYVETGWRLGLDPHPLFRTTDYLSRYPEVKAAGVNPLLHYLSEGWSKGYAPHAALAGSELVRPGAAGNALAAYAAMKVAARPNPFIAFSPQFYMTVHPEIDWETDDPLFHYLSIGARRGDMPNPAFDPAYYRSQHMGPVEADPTSPIEHYQAMPTPRPRTFALFDAQYYLANNADLAGWCTCPMTHFLEHGVREGRKYGPFTVDPYFYETFNTMSFADRPVLSEYLRSGRGTRARFICVGHEGTRTGAPGIILKIAQQLADFSGIECISILDQPGPLVLDHACCSLTLVPRHHRNAVYGGTSTKQELFDELDAAFAAFADNPPLGVFCNSVESRIYADYFNSRGIPVVMLMHEIAGFYGADDIEDIVRNSDRLVFPAEYVANALREAIGGDSDRFAILPQGLLREGFGDLVVGDRRTLFAQHDLEVADDDVVVLACGTIDGRKGFDLFVQAARLVKERCGTRVKFVWVGGRPNWRQGQGATWDTTGYWASWDVKRLGLDDVVIVVNEVANPEPFFTHASIFLMSSRADPFPCVVHEAMAARLPIITFEDAGGTPEAILPGGGLTVPYLDVEALADAIVTLAENRSMRHAMGATVRERVLTTYRFDLYVDRLLELMQDTSLAAASAAVGTRAAPGTRSQPVYFTTPAWNPQAETSLGEMLVAGLNDLGHDAALLLTAGRFGVKDAQGKSKATPDVPYRYLQPPHHTPAAITETLDAFLIANAPCTLIIGDDAGAKGLLGRMPPRVTAIGSASGRNRADYAEMYKTGRDLDAIVAPSDKIRDALIAMNPAFADKLYVVDGPVDRPTIGDGASAVLATAYSAIINRLSAPSAREEPAHPQS